MGSLATALDNLAAVPVSGVTSYALDDAPDSLGSAQLPALVIQPELNGHAPGMTPNRFTGGEGRLAVQIAHVLLFAPITSGIGLRGALPDLIATIDTYAQAMAADPLLDGALSEGLRFSVHIGVAAYGGMNFHAATFVHNWLLQVS